MYYLAYGMNTNVEQMARRCPKSRSLGTVVLKGHRLAFKGCCDAVVDATSEMECALWDITSDCESALDMLEGFPDYYGKKEVTVYHNGRKIRAMIYFMQDISRLSMPSESYLNIVVQGYADHNMDIFQVYRALEELTDVYHH